MAISLANGDGKEFSFMFRGSFCQGDFFEGAEDYMILTTILQGSNIVVELLQ